MQSDTKTRLEERAQVWEQFQAIRRTAEEQGRDLTAEELAERDKLNEEIGRLSRLINDEEREAKIAGVMSTVSESPVSRSAGEAPEKKDDGYDGYDSAFRRWARFGSDGMTAVQRQLLHNRFFTATPEMRSLGVGTGSAGGYAVPQMWRDKIIETLKLIDSVRSVAEVISTDTGAIINWPTVDDTANVGAILAENTQVTEQDVTLGTATLNAYMYTSRLVRVSLQLMQDEAFDLDEKLPRMLGARIARIQNTHFTTGTGASQPNGIQTASAIGKTGLVGQTTTVIYDDLIDLVHSVDRAYRGNGNGKFMLNDLTLASIRKLKDANNLPLWQPSLQLDKPGTILGYEYVVNNDMPVMAANAKSILFGDFREGYLIRDVTEIQTLRLSERYADFLQVAFLLFLRSDATQQNAAAYKSYRNSAT